METTAHKQIRTDTYTYSGAVVITPGPLYNLPHGAGKVTYIDGSCF